MQKEVDLTQMVRVGVRVRVGIHDRCQVKSVLWIATSDGRAGEWLMEAPVGVRLLVQRTNTYQQHQQPQSKEIANKFEGGSQNNSELSGALLQYAPSLSLSVCSYQSIAVRICPLAAYQGTPHVLKLWVGREEEK